MANTAVKNVALCARILFLIIILLALTTSVSAKRYGGGRQSPSSGGSHWGSSHSHGYGTNSHGTGTHYYPSSNGLSGTGTGSVHTYPASNGMSGNNFNNHITKQTNTPHYNAPSYGSKTEVHHHHHYSPPQQVSYGSVSYPVYHAQPPVYVYQYRDSGSRFDNLLTGLALYNLGKMSASHHHHGYDSERRYVATPGEVCKLGVRKSNGDYEESRVNCELMSSFIWESDLQPTHQNAPKNTVSTSVVNVTQTHLGDAQSNNSLTTVTVTNTTVVDALEAKGQSIRVTPDMTCYMIRITRTSNMKKEIKCGVLEAYAQSSWRNSAVGVRISSLLPFALLVIYYYKIN